MPTATIPSKKDVTDATSYSPYEPLVRSRKYFSREQGASATFIDMTDYFILYPGQSVAFPQNVDLTMEIELAFAKPVPENTVRKIRTYDKLATIVREANIRQVYYDEDFEAAEWNERNQ